MADRSSAAISSVPDLPAEPELPILRVHVDHKDRKRASDALMYWEIARSERTVLVADIAEADVRMALNDDVTGPIQWLRIEVVTDA